MMGEPDPQIPEFEITRDVWDLGACEVTVEGALRYIAARERAMGMQSTPWRFLPPASSAGG